MNVMTNQKLTTVPKKETIKHLGIILLLAIVITPLGLLAVGTAYGEWSSEDLQQMLGYVPNGIKQGEKFWKAPIADYSLVNLDSNFGYWISALVGTALIMGIFFLVKKSISKREVTH
jgi:hypothetical protein